ncbi:hypothetical protein KUTeg_020995 [Tegillarca granosa]|uniref:Phytanoyl-CoA dioxygenase n=1 Tax=Tegillarca granosa TaxID=220873 RepID=A0ABQ9EFH3_TEGGR|nr:hypothetical protein KUTeg_020995 [Tegillarca granosa]
MADIKILPGFTDEEHPEVFNTPPPQPKQKKPGQLTPEQLHQFFDKISSSPRKLYEEYGFERRLYMLDKEWPGAVMLLLKLGQLPQAFRDLWGDDRLLNVVEQLVGPEISASPVWNLRPKAPDSSYFDNNSYSSMVATAWVPFVDATKENGCIEMLVGGQKKGLDFKKDTELCEVPYGGVLFFSNCAPHRSIPNVTDTIRWSIDLRWQSSEKPDGFWGLKPGVPMRSAKNPDLKIDWDEYDSFDRYRVLKQLAMEKSENTDPNELENEFDTTLTGPHFEKYEILAKNRHIDAYFKKKNEENQKN